MANNNTTTGINRETLLSDHVLNNSYILNSTFRNLTDGHPPLFRRYPSAHSAPIPPLTETTLVSTPVSTGERISVAPEGRVENSTSTFIGATWSPEITNTTRATGTIWGSGSTVTGSDTYWDATIADDIANDTEYLRFKGNITQFERNQLSQLYGYLSRTVKGIARDFNSKNTNSHELVESRKVHALLLKVLPFLKKHFDLKSKEDYPLDPLEVNSTIYARCWYRLTDEFNEYRPKTYFTIVPYSGVLKRDMANLVRAVDILSKTNSEVSEVLSGTPSPFIERSYYISAAFSPNENNRLIQGQIPFINYSRPNSRDKLASFGMELHNFWESTLNERY